MNRYPHIHGILFCASSFATEQIKTVVRRGGMKKDG